MKRKKWLCFVLVCVTALVISGCPQIKQTAGFMQSTDNILESDFEKPQETDDTLTIHFLDVGQGDCTLLVCGADAMLIDAGNNNQGSKVCRYLMDQGITKLRYVIGTNGDADHIGGLDVVLNTFDCETVIMPEAEKNNRTYGDVLLAMEQNNYDKTLPAVGNSYDLGTAVFTVLSPKEYYEKDNNNSVCILLRFGERSFLFTGDAEEEAEQDMADGNISIKADVYKAGHHGSATSTTEAFLNEVNPSYVVISCGRDNLYGHPHEQVMEFLREKNVQMFRTDCQGNIILTCNGTEIAWSTEPSDNWESGRDISENEPEPPGEIVYVCNTNSYRFHYPGCESVEQMKEYNKWENSCTREQLMELGYKPCGNCKP